MSTSYDTSATPDTSTSSDTSKTPTTSGNRWDKAMLAEMRQVGDPQADRVVAAVIDGQGIERVNDMRMAT